MSRALTVTESHAVLAQHARSFRAAAVFLPRDRRDDAAVLYAFCRLADDAVDEASSRDEAEAALGRLAAGLEGAGEPISAAVAEMTLRRGLPLWAVHQLLAGMAGDLEAPRLEDDTALLRYCYHAAGTVGLLMARLVGAHEAEAQAHAVDLGIAMQLTNICRDVAEDAARGRSYLPRRRLEAAGTDTEALIAGTAEPDRVARVVLDLLALAESYYESADRGMRFIPARARLAIFVAGRLYRAIGRRLRRRGGDALAGRTVLSLLEKTFWVIAAFAAWAGSLVWPRSASHRAELHADLGGLFSGSL